jgi:GT2 family glycosyltransferase
MSDDFRDDQRAVEEALRDEVEQLGRIVDEQDRTIGRLRLELLLHSSAIGWRLQQRLEPLRKAMQGGPVRRQIYRGLYRALDLWVDFGVGRILAQARHKMGLALRGRTFLVEARTVRPQAPDEQYRAWLERRRAAATEDAPSTIARFQMTPTIGILVVLKSDDPSVLRRLIGMLQAQVYDRWELCAAMAAGVRRALGPALEEARRGESRLRVAPEGSAASLAECARLSSGEFLYALEAGDALAPDALFELVRRINQQPDADTIYSDEDWITEDGERHDPLFKPDWSPDLLLSTNYLASGLFRRRLIDRVGGFRAGAGRAELYDLVLRLTEASQAVAHVPQVLHHRRRVPTTVETILDRRASNRDEMRVLNEAMVRRGRPGQATALYARSGMRAYAARFDLQERPLVSIIIPTRDRKTLLETTIESIRARTAYDRYEILVVDNDSTSPDAVAYLGSLGPPCRVFQWRERFNYSAINNFGARQAQGEQLLFLNNDVEVIQPDWLNAMLEHAQRTEVGAVGAELLYGDGRIQHAGVVVGINRSAANAYRGWPGETIGNARLADLTRNCSAVTGACMMVPRRVFDEVGGFDESLRVVLNDVDLCLRIRQKGYLVVYTPHARLYHYEGASRGLLHPPPDQQRFEEKWSEVIARVDPYYNPNLAQDRDDWSLAPGGSEDPPLR